MNATINAEALARQIVDELNETDDRDVLACLQETKYDAIQAKVDALKLPPDEGQELCDQLAELVGYGLPFETGADARLFSHAAKLLDAARAVQKAALYGPGGLGWAESFSALRSIIAEIEAAP